MKRLSIAAALAFLAAAPRSPGDDAAAAPAAHDWTLPLYTKEGFRQMTLKGDEMQPVSQDRIDVTGVNFTFFSGASESRVDSVLLSPRATFLINERIARGDQSVRLVRDDLEVAGEDWQYFYLEKKVLIRRNAHVVFHAALPSILK